MANQTKLLGTRVTEEIHTLAHMTARSQNKTLSKWLKELIEQNIQFFLPIADKSTN